MADLIGELKEYINHLTKSEKFEANLVAQILSDLVKKYDWRPVSEPPENPGEVLITKRDGTVELGCYYGSCFYNPFHCDAVAWMLPLEPYKEGK
jgi:hypothetical protein